MNTSDDTKEKKIKSKAVEMAWMLKHLLCTMRSGVWIPRTSINAGQEQKPADNFHGGKCRNGDPEQAGRHSEPHCRAPRLFEGP